MSIFSVTVVTQAGVKEYHVGGTLRGRRIEGIEVAFLSTNGDQFEHYCMVDLDGKMIASVDKMCPCDVTYA